MQEAAGPDGPGSAAWSVTMETVGWLLLLALVAGVGLAGQRALARRKARPTDRAAAGVPAIESAFETESTIATEFDAPQVEAQATAHAAALHEQQAQARRAADEARARAEVQQAEEQAALRAAYEQAAADAERREARALAAEQAREHAERLAHEDAQRRALQRDGQLAAEATARAVAAESAMAQATAAAAAEAERAAAAAAAEAKVAADRAAAAATAAAAADRAAAAARPAIKPPPRTPAQTLVMVADDSRVVRVKTSRVLAKHGYRFALAEDGEQALALLAAELPQIVITDVEMPGVDGFELTRRMRADPRSAGVPIVMITAADDRLRSAAAEAGVTVVLGKPYDDDTLVAHIEALTGVCAEAAAPA
jgi:CheY-like chemotaxis protein